MNLLSERSKKRWYPLRPHPVQSALIDDDVRFKLVHAGRRSGKTERAKRFLIISALKNSGHRYFAGAPTRDQAKRIWWDDLKLLGHGNGNLIDGKPSETELIIRFKNGSSISVLGLDQPARIEGALWHGGVIDEIANIKAGAWQVNIAPALDTMHPDSPGYRAWCWLIGVPEGLNHFYDLAQLAEKGTPGWKSYHWKSSDILDPADIDAAKARMSARQFRQEYEASFETAQGRIYSDYGPENHTNERILPHEQLFWHHDFNFSPLSSGIGVKRGEKILVLDEIILQSAVARQSAVEFCEKFQGHQNKSIYLYGDPAGKAGEKHGQQSNYTEIENCLRSNGWNVTRRVHGAAPAIKDRQNVVRAMIANAAGVRRLFVNPTTAPYAHQGLATVQFKKGSSFLEEESEYQHITTAIGYWLAFDYPIGNELKSIRAGGF